MPLPRGDRQLFSQGGIGLLTLPVLLEILEGALPEGFEGTPLLPAGGSGEPGGHGGEPQGGQGEPLAQQGIDPEGPQLAGGNDNEGGEGEPGGGRGNA